MIDQLIERIQPERLKARLAATRHEAHTVRLRGQLRLWSLQADGLDRAQAALAAAPARLDPLARPLKSAVEDRYAHLVEPPIADYDSLGVKKVDGALRELDLIGLERVARYEASHKDRITVLRAVERERERRLAA